MVAFLARPRYPLLGAALLAAALLLWPQAADAKRVVVKGFGGPNGGSAARKVRRGIGGRSVSAGAFRRAKRNGGFVGAAKKLRVAGVVSGRIKRRRGRWVLQIAVRSGHTGRTVGRATFTLRGSRLDGTTARRVSRAVRRYLRACKAPKGTTRRRRRRRRRRRPRPIKVRAAPVPAPAPKPKPRGFDDGSDVDGASGDGSLGDEPKVRPRRRRRSDVGGFDIGGDAETPDNLRSRRDDDRDPPPRRRRRRRRVDDDDDDDGGSTRRRARRDDDRPPWETIIEVFAGLHVQRRDFSIVDPVNLPQETSDSYDSGVHASLTINAAIFPFAAFTRNAMADIGLVARYDRVVGLKSKVGADLADTLSQTFELGLRYRWNIIGSATSPILMAGVEYGRQMFFILKDAPPLPNITYDYLKLALVRVDWPFYARRPWRVGVGLAFDYLLVFSAGDIENEDSTSYGSSSTGGINGELSFFFGYNGFSARVQGFYRRYFYAFDRICAQTTPGGCLEAGGALDQYLGVTLNVGYRY